MAIALVGILIVSTALVALGSRESRAFPSADSYLPSGSSAFAELLRQSHYKVVIDHNSTPKTEPGDLVVAFDITAPAAESIISSEADTEQVDTTRQAISTFVEGGGKVLSLPVQPDFAEQSRYLYDGSKEVVSKSDTKARVSWDEAPSRASYLGLGDEGNAGQLWYTATSADRQAVVKTPFVSLISVGKGQEASFANGIIATNRFIDRQQNALVLMDTIAKLAPRRIVFAEATFGNIHDPSLLETIGPWALAAWFQLVFLGAVIIYTLGKPFGLPDPERRQERGARDLMDAMADTLRRGRMSKLALKTVFEDTNRFLRKMYRDRRDPDRLDLPANTVGDLQRSLNKLEAAAEIGAPEDIAANMIQDVERLVREAGAKSGTPY